MLFFDKNHSFMNKNINKLAEQCWDRRVDGELHFDIEQFAELIVRECAQFIFVLDAKPVSHKNAARMLQKHFGVEEFSIDERLRNRSTYFGNNP